MNEATNRRFDSKAIVRWSRKIEIVLFLGFARFLIKFIPFRYWRKLMGPVANSQNSVTRTNANDDNQKLAILLGRYVRQTAKRVPFKAVCLPQAMAARWALARRNLSTELHIGARPGDSDEPIDLHAWLMFGSNCLTGNRERLEFEAFRDERKGR